jgi:antitoxin VapB
MTINIKDPRTDLLARQLANLTGESLTEAIREAVADRLAAERRKRGRGSVEEIRALIDRLNEMPVLDDRSIDEMLYDDDGLPK